MAGSCIDLVLTSRRCLHQQTQVLEAEMNDNHLMIYTMFKSTYTKLQPKFLHKRQYKNFSKEFFFN